MFHDAGAVRFRPCNFMLRGTGKIEALIEPRTKASEHASIIEAKAACASEQPPKAGRGSTMPGAEADCRAKNAAHSSTFVAVRQQVCSIRSRWAPVKR